MAGTFTAQVDKWVSETKERLVAVHSLSTEKVVDAILLTDDKGGNLPFDLGFLRSSFRVSLNAPTLGILKNESDGPVSQGDDDITLALAGLKLGDDVYGVFGAAYAMRMEYGYVGTDALGRTYNQSGYGFVRLAVQRWQEFVDEATAEAKSAVAANSGR